MDMQEQYEKSTLRVGVKTTELSAKALFLVQSREYTDKEDNKRYAIEIKVERWFFVGGKKKNDKEA